MNVKGMGDDGSIVPAVERGKNISVLLLFYNSGEEILNAHAVFKCYKKSNGQIAWEFATLPRKVMPKERTEFIVEMGTAFLLPERYFIESAVIFGIKHVEKSTRVFKRDFRVTE